MKILQEKPSRSVEIEISRFLNLNINQSPKLVAKDVFYSLNTAIENSKMNYSEQVDFWLELENFIIKAR
jgi:hypothetical protein